jgi:hypothetical protein
MLECYASFCILWNANVIDTIGIYTRSLIRDNAHDDFVSTTD